MKINQKDVKKSKKKEMRSSKWTFLLYKESAPKDFIERLDNKHIPYILSPLHDKDINSETGELKKPHWHGCLVFESLKSQSQVSKILEDLNGPKYVEVVHSPKGMYDYFVHANNPEKTRYKAEDIRSGCGFNLEKFIREQDEEGFISKVIDVIEEKNFYEFRQVVVYARKEEAYLLSSLIDKAYFFGKYLDSRRHEVHDNEKAVVYRSKQNNS